MKCSYRVLDGCFGVYIDERGVWIEKDGKVNFRDISFANCFNNLISLFSLKEEWENKKCLKPIYQISFEKEKKETFVFGENVPSNFSLFLAYIHKLVGEYDV